MFAAFWNKPEMKSEVCAFGALRISRGTLRCAFFLSGVLRVRE